MQSTNSVALVESYLNALEAQDPERIRAILAESGFSYQSPIARIEMLFDPYRYRMLLEEGAT